MIIGLFLVLGLCAGSFVNALVWRLHEQAKPKKKRAASDHDLSVSRGRSMCPNCKHQLAAHDLIPVISWLSLKGKCRYCKKPISWQYPLVELLTSGLFVWSYLAWPLGFGVEGSLQLGFWLVFMTGFMALAIYDLRWMLLPDKIVYPLTALAGLLVLAQVFIFGGGLELLLNVAASVAIAGGIFYALFQISKGTWIGGGDVKLGLLIGLILGRPALSMGMLFLASVLGCLYALPLLNNKKLQKTSRIPFGPFLMLATIVLMIYGPSILVWYRSLLIPA
jgi:prepilin signal peptidase PulO-like enzyme (type II secretory pathway)